MVTHESPSEPRAPFAAAAAHCRSLLAELPETTMEPFGTHYTLKVRAKTFAYLLDNHHGDGRLALWLKPELLNAELVASNSEVFFIPPYVGPRGWVGIRLDVAEPDWQELREFIIESYLQQAPKSLARQVANRGPN